MVHGAQRDAAISILENQLQQHSQRSVFRGEGVLMNVIHGYESDTETAVMREAVTQLDVSANDESGTGGKPRRRQWWFVRSWQATPRTALSVSG